MLEMVIITPMANLVEKYMRLIVTKHVCCTNDAKTGITTLEIKKKGESNTSTFSYDSRPYRKYYWTNERINA